MIWIFTPISAADPEEETTQICHKLFPPTPLRLQGCISVFQGCISLLSTSGLGPTILHPECRNRAGEDPHSLHLHEPAQAAWLQGCAHSCSIFLLICNCLLFADTSISFPDFGPIWNLLILRLLPGQSGVEEKTDPGNWVRSRIWTQLKAACMEEFDTMVNTWNDLFEAGYSESNWQTLHMAEAPSLTKFQLGPWHLEEQLPFVQCAWQLPLPRNPCFSLSNEMSENLTTC